MKDFCQCEVCGQMVPTEQNAGEYDPELMAVARRQLSKRAELDLIDTIANVEEAQQAIRDMERR